jgi:acetoin utilization deacetylase AcuC-like enzyme
MVILLMMSVFFSCSRTPIQAESESRTGLVWNEIAMSHTQVGHPESALRVRAIVDELKKKDLWSKLRKVPARAAMDDELLLVHSEDYIEKVKKWSASSETYLDREKWSPYRSPYVLESARTAAGGLIDLVNAVAEGKVKNGFALVRPPGHHALRSHGMGFCIFNNVAIAAKSVRKNHSFKRIAIVDIDAHHGNGTQSIFENDPDTLYVSFHQAGFFPYTGNESKGSAINLPMGFQSHDRAYQKRFESVVAPALMGFQPDLILVSAGYDGHWMDYMSNLGLTLDGYAWLSQQLIQLAEKTSHGRIVFTLEGGYELDAVAGGVANTIRALLGHNDFQDPIGPPPF